MRGNNGLNTRFVRYLIGSHHFTNYIKSIVTGINVPHISGDQIKSYRFTLPPLAIQRKIASILSAYDDLIENNNRRIAILEAMSQALYREWFVEFRFPGHEKVKLAGSPLGKIPKDWSVVTMNDAITEIIDYRGKTPKKLGGDWSDSGIIALSALNVKNGCLVSLDKSKYVDDELYAKWMKSEVRQGDILMTSEAPLGEVYYVSETRKYCLSQRLFSIRANDAVVKPTILYLWLRSVQGQKHIHARATGTTVVGIRQSQLRELPILAPESSVQNAAHGQVDAMLRLIHSLTTKNANLRKTRDLLLPKLISGQLDVDHLDIDIGAAVTE
jgi:type I restriction enzyme S subunit